MTLTGKTRVAGVVGNPIAHSMSPVLHNAWLAAAGVDGVYVPFSVAEARFASLVEGLRGGSVAGLNVTLPFKSQALALADTADIYAQLSGAANVLVFEGEQIRGYNTDSLGMLGALKAHPQGFQAADGPVVVLGAGGAAKGGVAALVADGAMEVWIANRTVEKAVDVAESVAAAWERHDVPDVRGRLRPLALERVGEVLGQARAVINATSAGLAGVKLPLPLEATPADCLVMDMTYKPLVTPLLEDARALGRPTVDGLEMLIGQAIPSFEYFYGQAPPAGVDVRGMARRALGI
jgi:shikimate dehydrogenase